MKQSVRLRDEKNELGRRTFEARLEENGDLVFDGWDFGQGVEDFMGCREYEWLWTVRAADIPMIGKALNSDQPLLDAIAARFAEQRSDEIFGFLKEHNIPFESWSWRGN